MFCLYRISYIEDYYETKTVVFVSEDKSKLDQYIVNADAKYDEELEQYNRYCKIQKQLKEIMDSLQGNAIAMPAPLPKIRGPLTKEQNRERQKLKDAYDASMRQYSDWLNADKQAREAKAIKLYCARNNIDPSVLDRAMLFGWISPPTKYEFEIEPVEVI